MNRFYGFLKFGWAMLWAGVATLVVFFPIMLAAMMEETGNRAFEISRLWAHFMLRVTGTRAVIRNAEKIDRSAAYVIIANHQSVFDILALVTTLGIQYRWIIKKEVLRIPFFGLALHASRNIFVDRTNRDKAIKSIRRGMERLPDRASVLVFAEGTRSADGGIGQFKKGGFYIAIDQSMTILPITINGSRKLHPRGALVFHSGLIEVVVGDPIPTAGLTEIEIDRLMDKTRQIILSNYDPDYP